jgi:hypothetical protein
LKSPVKLRIARKYHPPQGLPKNPTEAHGRATPEPFAMSDEITTNKYYYDGALGEVCHRGRYFFAWKDHTILIGTNETFDEAIAALKREAEYQLVDQYISSHRSTSVSKQLKRCGWNRQQEGVSSP